MKRRLKKKYVVCFTVFAVVFGIWEYTVPVVGAKSSSHITKIQNHCSPQHNTRNQEWAPYYKGKLSDSHFHIPSSLDVELPRPRLGENITIKEMVCTLKREGTTSVFAFFPIFTSYPYADFIAAAVGAEERYPQKFIPFLMPPGKDDIPPSMPAKKIQPMLRDYRGLFQGYGEIGLYDLENRSADDYPPDAPIFQKIYPLIRKHKMMVYFHPGNNHEDNLEQVLTQHPDIDFIVHGDQIQPYIDDLMDQYDNIYYSVDMLYGDQYLLRADGTKKEFLKGFENFETIMEIDLTTWKPLIEKHPNRFMWATDRGDALAKSKELVLYIVTI